MSFLKAIIYDDVNRKKLLTILLPLLSVIVTYFIAASGGKMGYLFIVGAIGLICTVLAFSYPAFGLYFTIVVAFFFADIKRLLRHDLPMGVYIDVLCVLTFVGVIIQKRQKRENFFANYNHPICIAFLVMIVYSMIQIFNPNGGPLGSSLIILRRFIALQLMFFAAVEILGTKEKMVYFLKFWLFFATIAALYACYQEWFGYPAYEMAYIYSDPLIEGLLSLDNGNYRKFSFLADPTSFGIMMSGSALLCLTLILSWKELGAKKYWLGLGVLVMVLAMSYSGTRTAYFAFLTGVAVYIMMTLSNRKTLAFAVIAMASFLLLLFAPIYNNATLNRVRSTFEFSDDASFNVRDINRHRIQPYMHSHPIGGGLGTTGGAPGELELGNSFSHPLRGFQTDSGFLRMALEYGWIGLILQCATFFLVLQQGVRTYYRSKDPLARHLLLAAVICIFSYVIAHYAQGAIGTLPGAFLFYSLIAMIIRLKPSQPIKNSLTPDL